jgi:replication factor C subunit 2/4
MHKLIILDEADSMTESAQQALRMVMTENSNTTRFALACNDSSKIIEPIQSRCAIVRFSKLQDEEVMKRLIEVMDQETIAYEPEGLEALIFTAEGDMRYGLNNLQATFAGFGKVTKPNVFKVCDVPHPDLMQEVIDLVTTGNFQKSCNKIDIVYNEGYNMVDIINTLTRVIQNTDTLPSEELRLNFLKEASVVKMRTLEGTVSRL